MLTIEILLPKTLVNILCRWQQRHRVWNPQFFGCMQPTTSAILRNKNLFVWSWSREKLQVCLVYSVSVFGQAVGWKRRTKLLTYNVGLILPWQSFQSCSSSNSNKLVIWDTRKKVTPKSQMANIIQSHGFSSVTKPGLSFRLPAQELFAVTSINAESKDIAAAWSNGGKSPYNY